MAKNHKIPARKTLAKLAGSKKRVCSHEAGFDVLHHDHVYNFVREALRRRCEREYLDFGRLWMRALEEIPRFAFDPAWICNHCNEQDGALKPLSHKSESWFCEPYVSLEPNQLQRLLDIKLVNEGGGLSAMREAAIPFVTKAKADFRIKSVKANKLISSL